MGASHITSDMGLGGMWLPKYQITIHIIKQTIVQNISEEIILYRDNYAPVIAIHKNSTIERREICQWNLPREVGT